VPNESTDRTLVPSYGTFHSADRQRKIFYWLGKSCYNETKRGGPHFYYDHFHFFVEKNSNEVSIYVVVYGCIVWAFEFR